MFRFNKLLNVLFSSILLICSGYAADETMNEKNGTERSIRSQKLIAEDLSQESLPLPEPKRQELFSVPRDLEKLNETLKDTTVEELKLHLPKNISLKDVRQVHHFLADKNSLFSNIRDLSILYSLHEPPLFHPAPGTNEEHGKAVVKALLPFIKESLTLEQMTLTYVLADTVLPELNEDISICLDCTGNYTIHDQIYRLHYLQDLARSTHMKYKSLYPSGSISVQFQNALTGEEFLYK